MRKIIDYIIVGIFIAFSFLGWFLYIQESNKNEMMINEMQAAFHTEEIENANSFADSVFYYKMYHDLVNRQYGINLVVEKTDSATVYSLYPPILHGWK